jgi:VPDSG-CTERM motif
MLAFSHDAHALALTIGDSYQLGYVVNGSYGDSDKQTYVNNLIDMALGTSGQANGQKYSRSDNAFSSLTQAVLAGHVNGTGTTIDLGSGGLYSYLFVNYSAPNNAAVVWYVGNLSGIITIPAKAMGYTLSGWTLFATAESIPDGGATIMLLGAALLALGVVRRHLKS